MNYSQGLIYIQEQFLLHRELMPRPVDGKTRLVFGNVTLEIPGYKRQGDYKVWYTSKVNRIPVAYSHEDLVVLIHNAATPENVHNFIDFLECIFLQGLQCENDLFGADARSLIFWLTLQEDLNYPMGEGKQGRKLTYQRYYEAVLAKLGHFGLREVRERTNNHYGPVPMLFDIADGIKIPVFYNLQRRF